MSRNYSRKRKSSSKSSSRDNKKVALEEVVTSDLTLTTWIPTTTACYVCQTVQDEDLTILCDGEGCNKEVHLYCLKPPLLQIPEGKWFCDMCSPTGTTKVLIKYFHNHEESKARFLNCSCQSSQSEHEQDYTYRTYCESLVCKLAPSIEDLQYLYSNKVIPPSEFLEFSLIGCRISVINTLDQIPHTGRILCERQTRFGQIEHLVQFKSGIDGRNAPYIVWLLLHEHIVAVFHEIFMLRHGRSSLWQPVQCTLRSGLYQLYMDRKEKSAPVSNTLETVNTDKNMDDDEDVDNDAEKQDEGEETSTANLCFYSFVQNDFVVVDTLQPQNCRPFLNLDHFTMRLNKATIVACMEAHAEAEERISVIERAPTRTLSQLETFGLLDIDSGDTDLTYLTKIAEQYSHWKGITIPFVANPYALSSQRRRSANGLTVEEEQRENYRADINIFVQVESLLMQQRLLKDMLANASKSMDNDPNTPHISESELKGEEVAVKSSIVSEEDAGLHPSKEDQQVEHSYKGFEEVDDTCIAANIIQEGTELLSSSKDTPEIHANEHNLDYHAVVGNSNIEEMAQDSANYLKETLNVQESGTASEDTMKAIVQSEELGDVTNHKTVEHGKNYESNGVQVSASGLVAKDTTKITQPIHKMTTSTGDDEEHMYERRQSCVKRLQDLLSTQQTSYFEDPDNREQATLSAEQKAFNRQLATMWLDTDYIFGGSIPNTGGIIADENVNLTWEYVPSVSQWTKELLIAHQAAEAAKLEEERSEKQRLRKEAVAAGKLEKQRKQLEASEKRKQAKLEKAAQEKEKVIQMYQQGKKPQGAAGDVVEQYEVELVSESESVNVADTIDIPQTKNAIERRSDRSSAKRQSKNKQLDQSTGKYVTPSNNSLHYSNRDAKAHNKAIAASVLALGKNGKAIDSAAEDTEDWKLMDVDNDDWNPNHDAGLSSPMKPAISNASNNDTDTDNNIQLLSELTRGNWLDQVVKDLQKAGVLSGSSSTSAFGRVVGCDQGLAIVKMRGGGLYQVHPVHLQVIHIGSKDYIRFEMADAVDEDDVERAEEEEASKHKRDRLLEKEAPIDNKSKESDSSKLENSVQDYGDQLLQSEDIPNDFIPADFTFDVTTAKQEQTTMQPLVNNKRKRPEPERKIRVLDFSSMPNNEDRDPTQVIANKKPVRQPLLQAVKMDQVQQKQNKQQQPAPKPLSNKVNLSESKSTSTTNAGVVLGNGKPVIAPKPMFNSSKKSANILVSSLEITKYGRGAGSSTGASSSTSQSASNVPHLGTNVSHHLPSSEPVISPKHQPMASPLQAPEPVVPEEDYNYEDYLYDDRSAPPLMPVVATSEVTDMGTMFLPPLPPPPILVIPAGAAMPSNPFEVQHGSAYIAREDDMNHFRAAYTSNMPGNIAPDAVPRPRKSRFGDRSTSDPQNSTIPADVNQNVVAHETSHYNRDIVQHPQFPLEPIGSISTNMFGSHYSNAVQNNIIKSNSVYIPPPPVLTIPVEVPAPSTAPIVINSDNPTRGTRRSRFSSNYDAQPSGHPQNFTANPLLQPPEAYPVSYEHPHNTCSSYAPVESSAAVFNQPLEQQSQYPYNSSAVDYNNPNITNNNAATFYGEDSHTYDYNNHSNFQESYQESSSYNNASLARTADYSVQPFLGHDNDNNIAFANPENQFNTGYSDVNHQPGDWNPQDQHCFYPPVAAHGSSAEVVNNISNSSSTSYYQPQTHVLDNMQTDHYDNYRHRQSGHQQQRGLEREIKHKMNSNANNYTNQNSIQPNINNSNKNNGGQQHQPVQKAHTPQHEIQTKTNQTKPLVNNKSHPSGRQVQVTTANNNIISNAKSTSNYNNSNSKVANTNAGNHHIADANLSKNERRRLRRVEKHQHFQHSLQQLDYEMDRIGTVLQDPHGTTTASEFQYSNSHNQSATAVPFSIKMVDLEEGEVLDED